MTELHLLWHKIIYGLAFCLFGGSSVWLAWQIASGRLLNRHRRSFVIGALTGLTAATMYVCIWLAVSTFRLLTESGGYTDLREMVQVLVAFSLNAIWFGLLPAMLFGGVTGVIIRSILVRHKAAASDPRAAAIGLVVCLGLVALWHLALALLSFSLSDTGNPFAFTPLFYLLFIGLPALIYLVVGVRISVVANQAIGRDGDGTITTRPSSIARSAQKPMR